MHRVIRIRESMPPPALALVTLDVIRGHEILPSRPHGGQNALPHLLCDRLPTESEPLRRLCDGQHFNISDLHACMVAESDFTLPAYIT
jgi:hypothetical protein